MTPTDSRPPLLKLGIALLAVNEMLVIGACGIGGVLGSMAILLGSVQPESPDDIAWLVVIGALVAFVLAMIAMFAILSLGVCAMAWRGSRPWVAGLIGVALVNCIVVVPNPVGILAAVFCVLGALEFLENGPARDKIHSVEVPPDEDTAEDTAEPKRAED